MADKSIWTGICASGPCRPISPSRLNRVDRGEHCFAIAPGGGRPILSHKSKDPGSETRCGQVNGPRRRRLKRILRLCVSAEVITATLCHQAQVAVC
jgi:hypothetical protein